MQDFNDLMEKWRKLLKSAKPENWKWQPPEEIEMPPPKEPPEEIKAQFDELVAQLPDMEEAILHLKFVDGLSSEEIAQILGSKKLLVTIIERGAIGRLAKMIGSSEMEACSWLAWWGKKKAEAIEAEIAGLPLRQATPECPSLDRLYVAHLRWDWTERERQHIRSCEYCSFMARQIRERLWHPSSRQLWKYVTQGDLDEGEKLNIHYHLETDNCRRCSFIMDRVLKAAASLLQIFAQPIVAASPVPAALSAEGFAGETQEEVSIEEGLLRARFRREQENWVARAEAKNVSPGSKALFIWLTPDGIEKIRYEAEFKPAFGGWFYAEAVVAAKQEQLGEGYFITALLPPTPMAST